MTPVIQHGFEERQRPQVAAIYVAAFERKLTPLFRTTEVAERLVGAELLPACCFTAADDAGRILGVAGFQHAGQRFINFSARALIREFGWLSGAVRYGAALLFERRPDPAALQMDGIAVHPDARGLGIGTLLIAALESFAAQQGYQGVKLDVVDSNPHARRLYERLGFVAQRTVSYPFLRAVGFTAITTMTKRV